MNDTSALPPRIAGVIVFSVVFPVGICLALALATHSLLWAGVGAGLVGIPVGLLLMFREALLVAMSGRQVKELMHAVVSAAPMSIVFYGASGRIHYANVQAREAWFDGRDPAGENFLENLRRAPEAMRNAVLSDVDGLCTCDMGGEPQSFHLSKRDLDFCGEPHTLLIVKQVTQEISRQEVEVWKKVIRVISHELNNSLAPISSLAHSARKLLEQPDSGKLVRVFDTIEERAAHLQVFLEGYARFARLPPPEPRAVEWRPFLDGVRELYPEVRIGGAPRVPGWFDPAQMQQVLINLLKNAVEAGGTGSEVGLELHEVDGGVRFEVHDRGRGFSPGLEQTALLPFVTTKDKGTGLGLPLCREIVEAHRGRMRLGNREGGGAVVTCWLPGRVAPAQRPQSWMPITQSA